MSDYFRTLDIVDLNRYIQKLLKVFNLTEQDHPYLDRNYERFLDDVKKSRPIEFGNITNDHCIILLCWFCTQFSFSTALVRLVYSGIARTFMVPGPKSQCTKHMGKILSGD